MAAGAVDRGGDPGPRHQAQQPGRGGAGHDRAAQGDCPPHRRRLLNRAREQLVDAAQDAGITLRQSYARVGKAAEHQAGRYAHARQYRRMQREIRKLRTWLGRVIRDVQRKGGEITGALKHKVEIAQRLHVQRRDSKNKLYALHAPETECIAKGKVRTPYEFGVKVSVAVTAKEGLVVGMRSMPGNPYDGHTVDSQIEQMKSSPASRPRSRWWTVATAASSLRRQHDCWSATREDCPRS